MRDWLPPKGELLSALHTTTLFYGWGISPAEEGTCPGLAARLAGYVVGVRQTWGQIHFPPLVVWL